MAEQQLTEQQMVQAIYGFAAEQMRLGRSSYQIEKMLVEKGLDQSSATAVVGNLATMRDKAIRQAAIRNMAIGGVICLIGLVITVGSYTAASSSPTGGSYVVAWGAVIFGGYRFFRAMMELR